MTRRVVTYPHLADWIEHYYGKIMTIKQNSQSLTMYVVVTVTEDEW